MKSNFVFGSAIILATILALGSIAATPALAELDVQVYRGEGAVGIIVSEGVEAGFEIALDENSFVTVTGSNASESGVEEAEEVVILSNENETVVVEESTGNETTAVVTEEGNETTEEISIEEIEIPHIGSVNFTELAEEETIANEEGNETSGNQTTTIDVIEEITGVNLTEEAGVEEVVSNEGNGTEAVIEDTGEVVALEDCIGGTLIEGYEEPRDFRICYLN